MSSLCYGCRAEQLYRSPDDTAKHATGGRMVVRPVDQTGAVLDAEFDVESSETGADIIFHARYGGRQSARKRNVDYFPALELLLRRLADMRLVIENVSVDSRVAVRLPASQRSLELSYPIRMTPETDVDYLRREICRLQRGVARDPAAGPKGGNNHKRIRISLDLSSTVQDATELSILLVGDDARPSQQPVFGRAYRDAETDPSVSPADVFTFDPALRERALAGHARTQNHLATFLRGQGLEPRGPGSGDPEYDIGWTCDKGFFVAEVKSLTGANQDRQLRLGIGQVLHYQHLLRRRYGPTSAVLAVENQPHGDWQVLCDELGITLTWPPYWPRLAESLARPAVRP